MHDKNFVELPNYDQSICFACGPVNDRGLKMKFYGNDKLVYSNITLPDYVAGWNGVSHGGIVSTLLDETMSWGAMHLLKRLVFTKNMTVNYIKPVPVSEMLRVESRVKELISPKEAIMSAKIFKGEGELCASSTGLFFLMDKERINKLGFVDQKEIDFYWGMLNSN